MNKTCAIAFSVSLAAMLAGCTAYDDEPASASTGKRECFFLSQVSGFTDAPDQPGGGDAIYVHTGPRDVYLFETFGACPELDFSETLGFAKKGPGTICRGFDVDLIVPSTIGPQRCPVRMIRKLTPEEMVER